MNSLGDVIRVMADTFLFIRVIKLQIRNLHTVILYDNSALDIMKVTNSICNYLYVFIVPDHLYVSSPRDCSHLPVVSWPTVFPLEL